MSGEESSCKEIKQGLLFRSSCPPVYWLCFFFYKLCSIVEIIGELINLSGPAARSQLPAA
jgi:hypothetical protein